MSAWGLLYLKWAVAHRLARLALRAANARRKRRPRTLYRVTEVQDLAVQQLLKHAYGRN